MIGVPDTHPGRRAALLAPIALALYWVGRAPFVGQWDSFDYLQQVVTHRLSDLGFGRPVFIGCNIAVWEVLRRIFRLQPASVENTAMAGVVVAGVVGVLLFNRLSLRILGPAASRLAVAAFLLSPVYALYSGYVMTEVPMLTVLLGAALLAWPDASAVRSARTVTAGVLFGAAVGIREQALMLGPAFLWILSQEPAPGRPLPESEGGRGHGRPFFTRRALLFCLPAALVAAAPILLLYTADPAAFAARMEALRRAIPTGSEHFGANLAATVLYTLFLAPGVWLAAAAGGVLRPLRRVASGPVVAVRSGIRRPAVGVVCGLVVPLALLWRDADVQIHPRYTLVALPAVVLLCARLYDRRLPGVRAALVWGGVQVLVFVVGQFAIQPFRQMQLEKRAYARSVLESAPPEAFLIAGAYSPVLDYYRAIGLRPRWAILWSGWGWTADAAAARTERAQREGRPILLCDGPWAWLYFEDERLDLHRLFQGRSQTEISPDLKVIGSQFAASVRSDSLR